MRATILHGPGDVRLETVPDPELLHDGDAVVRVVATCICGSDLWRYRGIDPIDRPRPIGHEFVGVVEAVGSAVATLGAGDFVVAPFSISDGTCAACIAGVPSSCRRMSFWGVRDHAGSPVPGAQGERVRVPLADGTLVTTPTEPSEDLVAHLLALSDVFCTGHHAATAAGVGPDDVVVVIGDGAVGQSAVLAARRRGAASIVMMSSYEDRQTLACELGAAEVVSERGAAGASAVCEICGEFGADVVLECVGTAASLEQALECVRPGGRVGYVGMPHGVTVDLQRLWAANVTMTGGIAPVRAYLDELVPEVMAGRVQPGVVFDRRYPLSEVAQGYRDMDARRTLKALLLP